MLSIRVQKQLDRFDLDVTLDSPEGKIIVLFGPSGAGKSLTLGALAGLVTPDMGRISIGELVLFDAERGIDLAPQERKIGLVRQDLALFPHLTVADNIAYGLSRLPKPARRAAVNDFLELMHLDGLGAHKPSEMSGGQQQRVALARALAVRPSLLLLDEPFSALDLPTRLELRAELKALHQRLKMTTLFVTHDLGEAFFLADYLAVLVDGRILQFDTPARTLIKPQSIEVAQMVGVKNILPAVVRAAGCVKTGERDLDVETGTFAAGAPVYVGIRPERISILRPERPVAGLPNVVEGFFVDETSDGASVTMQFRAQGERLQPDKPFDLQIDLPVYVYERLNLAKERNWRVSIKRAAINLLSG